jgi:hypothetical protein
VQAQEFGPPDQVDVAHAVEGIIASAFAGDVNAYRPALAAAGLDDTTAAILIGNQLGARPPPLSCSPRRRERRFDLLTVKRAAAVQKTAICLGDQLPRATTVDGLDAVPFLRLPQPSATIATDTSSGPSTAARSS